MEPIFIYAVLFVAALLLVDTVLRLVLGARRSTSEINTRLRTLTATGNQSTAYNEILKRRGLSASERRSLPQVWFSRLYTQSGLHMTPVRRAAYVLGIFLISVVVVATFVGGHIAVKIGLSLVLTAVICIGLIIYRRNKRLNAFIGQLPGAVDIVIRSLNAGHPLNAAIALVAKEMSDPIGSEFGILSDQLTFGADLETAMMNMYDRVGASEIKLLAVTVTVQRGTGGNLAEILENLSGMIRARIMLKAKIRAISAEGRITAIVMGVFPFLLYLMIVTLVPTYFVPLWESGYGTQVVIGCAVMMLVGMFVLYRLVNFDF